MAANHFSGTSDVTQLCIRMVRTESVYSNNKKKSARRGKTATVYEKSGNDDEIGGW